MMLDGVISFAEPIVAKWNVRTSPHHDEITYLFSQNSGDEVSSFLDAVSQLHRSMHLSVSVVSTVPSVRRELILAQTLMEMAMKRLQMEFYQILRTHRAITTSHDNSDEIDGYRFSDTAMRNMKTIVEFMISCGYTMECLNIYQLERKSIVDEVVDRVVFRNITLSTIQKLDWESMKTLIENWLAASKIEIKKLFSDERILCEYIFGASSLNQLKESCFANITRDFAVRFFQFPELVTSIMIAKKNRKTKNKIPLSEKMFHILDLYTANYDLTNDIQIIFSYSSTAAVRKQTKRSLKTLGESARTLLSEFEYTVEKDAANGSVRGGGVHPLSRRTMNFLVSISEYDTTLSNIFVDQPLPTSTPPNREPTVSGRLSWLLRVLQCKINGKATAYSDVSLLYIFLANNLKYVITKVKESNLYQLLGRDWVVEQEKTLSSFLKNYETATWGRVSLALAQENIGEFNSEFRHAWQVQLKWVAVEEGSFRDEIITMVKKKVLVPYQDLYRKRTNQEGTANDMLRFEYINCIFRGDSTPSESDQDCSSRSGSGSYSSNNFIGSRFFSK
ncbi:hypothetical protein ZOSMA_168G00020 [Zostera marina]|uniref:Exocyst subunit Exo70 family protein n=1 Tax=Zostera marina TaxID=29655 RepID=A0A0K9PTH2_ZOSMR|nr:hypothetical protein ZOSMA_168G00020 [Zostera marina]